MNQPQQRGRPHGLALRGDEYGQSPHDGEYDITCNTVELEFGVNLIRHEVACKGKERFNGQVADKKTRCESSVGTVWY